MFSKLFLYQRNKRLTEISILNFPIIKKIKQNNKKELKIFAIPIYTIIKTNESKTKYVLGIKVKTKYFTNNYLSQNKNNLEKDIARLEGIKILNQQNRL